MGVCAVRARRNRGGGAGTDLLHREWVNDLGAVVGQLRGLVGRDRGDDARGRDFARVRREEAVDLFPDLEFRCGEADGDERGQEVSVPAAHLAEEGAGHGTEEACAAG